MTDKEFDFQYALGTIPLDDLFDLAKYTSSTHILKVLSKHTHFHVRSFVAGNKYTPVDVLTYLSKDRIAAVRC